LKPWEFWRLTPRELNDMHAAAIAREGREHERMAWGLSYVLSLFSKKPITMDDLLGRKPKPQRGAKRLFLEDVLDGGRGGLEEKLKQFDENWQKRKQRRRNKRARSKRQS
jgi:hypothetical protein